MSIASEITNYANGLSDAYNAVNDMQGIIPQDKNMNNLDSAIRTIPQSQGSTYTAGDGIDITNDVISATNTGKYKILTSADYNWPENNPTFVSLGRLSQGAYWFDKGLQVGPGNYSDGASTCGGLVLISDFKSGSSEYKTLVRIDTTGGNIRTQTVTSGGGVSALNTLLHNGNIKNNLTTTTTGFVLDATQGKALKDLIDGLAISGAGAPTTSTTGTVGQLYEDTTNGKLYICTDVTGGVYTWTEVGSGGATYTAGNGINIDANNEISIDDTVVAELSDLPTDFTGATSSVAGTHGLVPAPTTADVDKVLKGDGTWEEINGGEVYYVTPGEFATGNHSCYIYHDSALTQKVTTAEFSEAALEGGIKIIDSNIVYTVTSFVDNDGTNFDPANNDLFFTVRGATSNAELEIWINAGSTDSYQITQWKPFYNVFSGATSQRAGSSGLVPAPAAGDEGKALHGDGTWKDTTAKLVEMSYGEANSWAKFIAAYNAGSIVYCRASSNANPATGSQTRKAFMAYVNNATSPTNVEFQYVRSQSSKTASQQCDQVFVYKLTNSNGGTWTVETRDMAPKIVAGTGMSSTFTTGANATITLNAEPNYSTSEVDTKVKWIDGNTIYRKTINVGALPAQTSTVTIAHGISNFSTLVKMDGIAYNSTTGSYVQYANGIPSPMGYPCEVTATDVVIHQSGDGSAWSVYVTLYYTKSS